MNLFSIQSEEFIGRHMGPNEADTKEMLRTIGVENMDELIARTVPQSIRMDHKLRIPEAVSEAEFLHELKETSQKKISPVELELGRKCCHWTHFVSSRVRRYNSVL